jgi:hypothetical protein
MIFIQGNLSKLNLIETNFVFEIGVRFMLVKLTNNLHWNIYMIPFNSGLGLDRLHCKFYSFD